MAHDQGANILQEQPQSAACADYSTQQTPDHFNTSFSAQAPAFQPLGNEMVRQAFHPTPPDSRHDSPLSPDLDLSLHVAHQDLKHTQDVVRLEHALRQSQQKVAHIEAAVGHDLRMLQAELAGLKYRQDQESFFRQERGEFSLKRERGVIEVVVPEPEVFLQRGVKAEHIAVLYSEQAEALRETALRLERDAEDLRGGGVRDMPDEAVFEDTPTRGPRGRLWREVLSSSMSVEGDKAAESGVSESNREDGSREAETQITQQGALNNKQPVDTADKTTPNSPPSNHSPWTPHAVRAMPPSPHTGKSDPDPEYFTASELHFIFHGTEWSPGYNFVNTADPAVYNLLRSKSYWLIDLHTDPFMPRHAGEHGAKLTAFFNQTPVGAGEGPGVENYMDVPVFVSLGEEEEEGGEKRYAYFGQYDQSRFSDRLDYDRLAENVPRGVKEFWARQLARPGRPEWVTRALMEHFWPRPRYEGPVPTDSAISTPASKREPEDPGLALEKRVVRALEAYAWELKAWEREARVKASCVSEGMVLAAFAEPDYSAVAPGLRLWWEYFECRGFDGEFYAMLCRLRHSPRVRAFVAGRGKVKGESGKKRVVGGGAQEANVKSEAPGKTWDTASSSSVEAEAPSPPPPKVHPPAHETTDAWPDWEAPIPATSSTNTPAPAPTAQTTESLFQGWDTYTPPVVKEHPYFPAAKTPPHMAVLARKAAEREKQREKVGWGDLEAAKEFQRDATKA